MADDKLRVCAYARVSTLAEDQAHSLMVQSEYYRTLLENDPKVLFMGIYADKKSGRGISTRLQFIEMVRRAKDGELDYIITKSIARFARNLVETLKIVRSLREIGVGIFFEKENIDSLKPESDFMLSICSTIAEAELSSIAENVRWSARKRYAAGSMEMRNNLYGYTFDESNRLVIIPEEAEIVKEVYARYLDGEGQQKIASILNKRKVHKKFSNFLWTSSDIQRMLTNEKYIGDALLQKSIYFNRKRILNEGQAPQYYVENDHEGIIAKEQFEKVQLIRKERLDRLKNQFARKKSPFTSKIICGDCGKKYHHRTNHRGTPYEKSIWSCHTYVHYGRKYCGGVSIRERDLKAAYLSAYNEAIDNKNQEGQLRSLNETLNEMLQEERNLFALRAKEYITTSAFQEEHQKILTKIKAVETEYKIRINKMMAKMPKNKATQYNDGIVRYLKTAEINGYEITFNFINGASVNRSFDNKTDRKATWAKKKGEDCIWIE